MPLMSEFVAESEGEINDCLNENLQNIMGCFKTF